MDIYLEWLAGNVANIMVIVTFLCFLIKPIRLKVLEKFSGDKAERKGLCALLRKNIISECKKAHEQGFMHFYDKENLEDMYEQYKALGGNHGIEALIEQTEKLPIRMLERGDGS